MLNRPGQNEKKTRTSLEAVQYVFNSPKGELITYYPAEFKIARENRYVWKICMILVSVVCRPAGHKKLTVNCCLTDYKFKNRISTCWESFQIYQLPSFLENNTKIKANKSPLNIGETVGYFPLNVFAVPS